MEFVFHYYKNEKQQLKYFLKEQGISKGLLAKIKFQGGKIYVNGQEENVLFNLKKNDRVLVITPAEKAHETLLDDSSPIDVVYEDEHLLVVNKSSGIASIPAQYHPNKTMANRVKAYYKRQGYQDQVVHIVTRLDRDTSGLMLFAKHSFCHALLDQQLRTKRLVKKYQAVVSGDLTQLDDHGWIDFSIERDLSSILKRQLGEQGKPALTEYWLRQKNDQLAQVEIQLHTGRTHQIRVHFAALGLPLAGDELYGGSLDFPICRQALHCSSLQLIHPFTKKELLIEQALPKDMEKMIEIIEKR